ncbi:MAG: InlB B-repeat-containing protein [archaeon]
MAILKDVITINPSEYTTTLNSLVDNQFRSLAQKEVDVTLISAEEKLRVKASFVNNNLRKLYFSNYEEKYLTEYPADDTTEMAKNFLQKYQNYVGDLLYGEFASILDNVDATKNTTKSKGNIKLTVLNTEQTIVDYLWTYTDDNGIVAESKNVVLSYDRGHLKLFLNNWPLYTIVGSPKISGDEATEIAIEASKTFSYDVVVDNSTITISGFDIAQESLGHEVLSYLNFPNQTLARGGDPFVLYPSWYVPIGFNKSYSGAVTGMTVTVWADTGEVSNTEPMVVNFASTTESNEKEITSGFDQYSTLLAVPIVVTALLSTFGITLVSRKKVKFADKKNLFPKFSGTLMCGILMLSVTLAFTPQVNAIMDPDSKAEIYAAYYGNPYQHPLEINAAEYVTAEIKSAFEASGYDASKWTDDDTIKSNVLDNASYAEDNFDRVAVFHFGHMAAWNEGYQDNTGANVSADEINAEISLTKHDFVFIWVCTQAQYYNSGMPVAWTSRTDLSYNGYSNPDYDDQVYIGFENISPQINNTTAFESQTTDPLYYWIEDFYDYALRDSYSVRDAINEATSDFFGTSFTLSILNTGYSAWFPGYGNMTADYYDGRMRIYGDGTLFVFQPTLTMSAGAGGSVSSPGTHRYTYGHNAIACAYPDDNYDFYEWRLDGQHYSWSQCVNLWMDDNHNLQAIFVPE